MITSQKFKTKMPLKIDPQEQHAGLSGLFAAAVVSKGFCEMLLNDPEEGAEEGLSGKGFRTEPGRCITYRFDECQVAGRPGQASGSDFRAIESDKVAIAATFFSYGMTRRE